MKLVQQRFRIRKIQTLINRFSANKVGVHD